MKVRTLALAGMIALIGASGLVSSAVAQDKAAKVLTVAAINKDKATLGGKSVSFQGKVVKVNNGIMGRNFVHVQDGTGDATAGTNNLIATSKQTAAVGDQIKVSGNVVLNRDFGMGYNYPLLIEEASIAPK
jgi:expansin (peptidoglycan-binding protein)